MSGGTCPNGCPLAQDASSHRSTGEEAVFASKLLRADYVKSISKAIADLSVASTRDQIGPIGL